MNDKNVKMGYLIRGMNHCFKNQFMKRGISCGLDEVTLMHAWILVFLHIQELKENPIHQKDLETHFGYSRSSVTSIVQMMEKKGFITRVNVPGDARLKRIMLTDEGRATALRVRDTLDILESDITQGIEPQELEVFTRVSKRIMRNLSGNNCCKN